MAIDPKHLPEDPQVLQRMVLDLMAQLDRESAERGKIQNLLRELLDAKRTRKSEQLSEDQLALFAAAWEERQTAAEASRTDDQDGPGAQPAAGAKAPPNKSGGRQPLARHLKRERVVHDLADSEKHCAACQQDLRPIGEESSERYEYIPPNCWWSRMCARNTLATAPSGRPPSRRNPSKRARRAPVCWPR